MSFREEQNRLPPGWSAAMKDLAHGQDSVAKLASLILQLGSPENQRLETAALLVEEIMGSISKAMAALEVGNVTAVNQVGSPSSCVTSNKQYAGGKRKTQSIRTAGYRRRGNPYSWTRITSTTVDDQHTWRKYGQKEIYSAKYPRSYFRCTHKFAQGCRASKQVQRSEEDPAVFVITYFGEHTCADAAKVAVASLREPCIISFESRNSGNMEIENPSSVELRRQDIEEEAVSNITSPDSPSEHLTSAVESGKQQMGDTFEGDYSESSSGLHALFNFGMDFVNFEDLFSEFVQD